jgi:hypothetical protein
VFYYSHSRVVFIVELTGDAVIDEVDAILDEALPLVRESKAREMLSKAQGIIKALLDDACKWDRIRTAYEAGEKTVNLSFKFGVTCDSISSKAWRNKWMNPNKLAKITAIRKNKNVKYLVCMTCEQRFETESGHAKWCNVCKAREQGF